jgi:PQQ-dependent catabolism-associated CXXCW motif protein
MRKPSHLVASAAAAWLCVALGIQGRAGAGEAPPPESTASVPEPTDYWTGALNGPVPATIAGGKVIHAAELAKLIKQKRVIVVDVSNAPQRPEGLPAESTWLPLPQRIIPGALWIAGAGMGSIEPAIEQQFREKLAAATNNDLAQPLVIYCHERCWLSWNAAKRAISYGYRNVYWFPEGIEGWRAAGLPTVTVDKPS